MTGFIVISFIGLSILVAVLSSQFASEQEESPHSNNDYYWGGLKLSWPIIMISLLVNHTTIQQLVMYNQQSFDLGYQSIVFMELITVVAMIVSALFILPKLIEANAKTIPEFIGARYDKSTQHISAFLLVSAYIFVLLPLSLLMGSWALQGIFEPRLSSEYIVIGLGLSGGCFGDQVYAALIRRLFPDWSIGMIAAVLFGLVISTFKSIVHSTVTLILGELTDLNESSHNHLNTDQVTQVRLNASYIQKSKAVVLGKVLVALLTGFAIFLARYLGHSPSLLPYLQKVNGLWSVPLGIIF